MYLIRLADLTLSGRMIRIKLACSPPLRKLSSIHIPSRCLLPVNFPVSSYFTMVRAAGFTPLLSLFSFFSFSSAGKVPLGSLASGTSSSTSNDHPVSVVRAQGSTGFHYSHAKNDEYTATIYVNGVPYQVRDYSATL